MEEQVKIAYDLIEHGNYWRAESIADRLLRSKEKDVELDAWLIKGIAAYQSEDLEKGKEAFRQALKVKQDLPTAIYYLALIAFDQGQFLLAQEHIDGLLITEPSNFIYLELKLEIEQFLQNKEEALQTINELLNLSPFLFEYKWDRADLKLALEKFDEAIHDYEQLLKWEDIDSKQECNILNNIGFTYWKKTAFYNAKHYLEKALALNEDHSFVLNNLGMVYADLGNLYEGINLIKKSIRLNPTNAYAYKNLGSIYFQRNEFRKALKHLKKAEELGYSLHYDQEAQKLIEKIELKN